LQYRSPTRGIPIGAVGVVRPASRRNDAAARTRTRSSDESGVGDELVTTFAALELLGPDYRWKTEAYLGGAFVNGVLAAT
jgi:D-alanyl-D-alanine carboxypeptidase/D-alanyl-D-alanine-endopeptidase (penicillin-binding protein 4)